MGPSTAWPSPPTASISLPILDRTVRLHEADSGRLVQVLKGHPDKLACLAFASDGRRLATLSKKLVRLWSIPKGEMTAELAPRAGAYLGVS